MANLTIFNNEPNILSLHAGQVLFEEGEVDNLVMYAVVDGEVEIVHHDRVLEVIQPGNVFGEMALLDHQPRSATARARTDSRVAALNTQRFVRLISHNPHFALELMRVLAQRVRQNMAS